MKKPASDELPPGRRWVELIDHTDKLSVLDERGERACMVTRLDDGGLRFQFRTGDVVEVPLN